MRPHATHAVMVPPGFGFGIGGVSAPRMSRSFSAIGCQPDMHGLLLCRRTGHHEPTLDRVVLLPADFGARLLGQPEVLVRVAPVAADDLDAVEVAGDVDQVAALVLLPDHAVAALVSDAHATEFPAAVRAAVVIHLHDDPVGPE